MTARRMRWGIVGAVAVALTLLLIWLFAPRPVSVETAPVVRGPIDEQVEDQGKARVREAYMVAAPVSGRLLRTDLHVGDRVIARRNVVARIRPAAADLQDPRARAQAEAAVGAAAAAVTAGGANAEQMAAESRRANDELARTRTLAQRGFASAQALETAEAAAKSAGAATRAARAELAMRRAELASARSALTSPEASGGELVTVLSPATGYVTRVIEPSERTLSMGAPLLEIADNTGLEAAIEFLSQDAVRIREGMSAEIYDWGGEEAIPAQVRRVEPQGFTKISALGVEEQRVLVMLQFTDAGDSRPTLAPGYRVWGRVFLRRETAAMKVPLGALVRANGGWAVFRVEQGRARLRAVSVGALTDREAEVTKGLNMTDRVVVFPSDLVRDGVAVKAR